MHLLSWVSNQSGTHSAQVRFAVELTFCEQHSTEEDGKNDDDSSDDYAPDDSWVGDAGDYDMENDAGDAVEDGPSGSDIATATTVAPALAVEKWSKFGYP